MEQLSVDATPDKSLIAKLGKAGYKTEQAIAELVDNAIDARIDGKVENIEILRGGPREIIVRDDGHGMDLDGLKRAWTLGGGEGESPARIGRFGIGMKSATSALGKRVEIVTGVAGSEHELILRHDEDEWISDKNASWRNIKVSRQKAPSSRHGTKVRVSCLRYFLDVPRMEKLREMFGVRYGPYIDNGIILISVDGKQCVSKSAEIEHGTKKEIDITTLEGIKIHGWIALLKKRSIKGNYGVHLYSKGRLIKPYAKFGIATHPTVAKFVGSVTLEKVPVNTFKTGFLMEYGEYAVAEAAFKKDARVREMLRKSSMKTGQNSQFKKILNPPDYPQKIRLPRLGEDESQKLLKSMGTERIESDWGLNVRLEDGGTGLYRIEKHDDITEIIVNRQSEVFRAFRNPLHLLVMIQAEAETFSLDPEINKRIEIRNSRWENRISNLVDARPKNPRLRSKDILEGDLTDLCEHIMKKYPHRFQFTALSTLAKFLNQVYRKIAYTVYTIKGTGNTLVAEIRNHGEFASLLNPTYAQLSTAFETIEDKNIVVVREYATIPKSFVASFEKSWVDLFVESTRKGMLYYKTELEMVEAMLNLKVATKDKIMAWAKRRKIEQEVEKYLEVQHSDS